MTIKSKVLKVMSWAIGAVLVSSIAFAAVKWKTDASGNIVTMNAQMQSLQSGETSNCGITYSAGTLTLTDEAGGALSAINPCCVGVPSTTAGHNTTVCFRSPQTINDDANASSHLTNLGFGITETAHWANDMPYFLYVDNEDNTDINAGIFLARKPGLSVTPTADYIHDKDAAAANDTQDSIFGAWADDSGKASKPCVLIGAIRMRWSTTTDDWTVQTLDNSDGIGQDRLKKTFAKKWMMPVGQNGAENGKYFYVSGGTAPAYSSNIISYTLNEYKVTLNFEFSGDGGDEGAGTNFLGLALPIGKPIDVNDNYGTFIILNGSSYNIGQIYLVGDGTYYRRARFRFYDGGNSTSVIGNSQNNTTRSIIGTITYIINN